MKKRTVDKGISAAGTVLFVGAIQTVGAPLWTVASLALVVYEIGQMICRISRNEARRQRRRRNLKYREADAHRWAEEWFNPYKGVRA